MKKVLIGIAVVVVIAIAAIGVLTMVTPTAFAVERDIVIDRPRSEVFDYVKMVKNQGEWGPWLKKDPKTKLEYEGEDGTVGFISRWESDHPEVGTGEQKIVKIVENERIDVELTFKQPWESTADGYTILEPAGEGKTKVRWGFTGDVGRPMNLLFLVMDFDEGAGKEFENGLATLKEILEKE